MHAPRLALVVAALVACDSTLPSAAGSSGRDAVVALPQIATHYYTLTGRIRPLLFWISRDNVGFARLTWRAEGGVRGYELLVGSDPRSAPRHLNRWGYVAETVDPAGGSLFALMTGGDEGSYDDAASAAERTPGEFRAIRSRVAAGAVRWETSRVPSERALTVFDLDAAVDAVRAAPVSNGLQERRIDAGVQPGFLSAVAALLDRHAGAVGKPTGTPAVRYVFGPRSYDLRVTDRDEVQETVDGAAVSAVRLRFDIRNRQTGDHTRFEVTSATQGPYARIPIRIAWQPHWWLGLELRLADGAGRPN